MLALYWMPENAAALLNSGLYRKDGRRAVADRLFAGPP
jgi:hypothetical protein